MSVYVCPVCCGRGRVPEGFYGQYDSNANPTMCRSCGGTGIVYDWRPKPMEPAPPGPGYTSPPTT